MTSVSMRQMLEAGVHFGHQTRFWNPKMAPFIFGERNKIHIINLEKTQPLYAEALRRSSRAWRPAAAKCCSSAPSARPAMRCRKRPAAATCPIVNQRWLGGMLTNFKTIRQSIKRLNELDDMAQSGALERRGKKEAQVLRREMDKLLRSLGGIREMTSLPDALFVIDVGHEEIAIHEAKKLGIPVVAVVDTNCSPEAIDYVIPGNDDAMRAILLYAGGVADAVLDGKASLPEVPVGEDEFVELDEEGNPKKRAAARRPQAAPRGRKPAPARRKVPVTVVPSAGPRPSPRSPTTRSRSTMRIRRTRRPPKPVRPARRGANPPGAERRPVARKSAIDARAGRDRAPARPINFFERPLFSAAAGAGS